MTPTDGLVTPLRHAQRSARRKRSGESVQGEREIVTVCVRDREREIVTVCVRDRESERDGDCVCEREKKRQRRVSRGSGDIPAVASWRIPS